VINAMAERAQAVETSLVGELSKDLAAVSRRLGALFPIRQARPLSNIAGECADGHSYMPLTRADWYD
jgi:hypothetical protein